MHNRIAPYSPAMPSPEPPAPCPTGADTASPACLEDLYEQFHRPAFALARRILVEDGLAEDVVQEAFLAVWRDPGAFDPARGGFSAWLMTLVRHKAVDTVRREEAHRRRHLATAAAWDVAGEACDRAVHAQVRTALSALPARQREALALAYFSGYSQQEIAVLTATPLSTVKSRSVAGVRQLRRELRRLAPSTVAATAAR